MTDVEKCKIKLYDIIERQAILSAEHNQMERLKEEAVKELNVARDAEAKANEPAVKKGRKVVEDDTE
jgi:hypothetical protein